MGKKVMRVIPSSRSRFLRLHPINSRDNWVRVNERMERRKFPFVSSLLRLPKCGTMGALNKRALQTNETQPYIINEKE